LTASGPALAVVAAKAALMYATALVGLRLGERRTLAQWTLIDFVAAVAVGAIVGRTAVSRDQSYAVGAIALATLVLVHRVASLLRFHPWVNRLTDHRVRVLVHDGQMRRRELRRCGLTDEDLEAELRLQGVLDVAQVRYALYEAKGGLTVVPQDTGEASLVDAALRSAAGFPDRR
jgi:uncharacterized membrane protein YcaP (DUF421 family)